MATEVGEEVVTSIEFIANSDLSASDGVRDTGDGDGDFLAANVGADQRIDVDGFRTGASGQRYEVSGFSRGFCIDIAMDLYQGDDLVGGNRDDTLHDITDHGDFDVEFASGQLGVIELTTICGCSVRIGLATDGIEAAGVGVDGDALVVQHEDVVVDTGEDDVAVHMGEEEGFAAFEYQGLVVLNHVDGGILRHEDEVNGFGTIAPDVVAGTRDEVGLEPLRDDDDDLAAFVLGDDEGDVLLVVFLLNPTREFGGVFPHRAVKRGADEEDLLFFRNLLVGDVEERIIQRTEAEEGLQAGGGAGDDLERLVDFLAGVVVDFGEEVFVDFGDKHGAVQLGQGATKDDAARLFVVEVFDGPAGSTVLGEGELFPAEADAGGLIAIRQDAGDAAIRDIRTVVVIESAPSGLRDFHGLGAGELEEPFVGGKAGSVSLGLVNLVEYLRRVCGEQLNRISDGHCIDIHFF